LKTIGGASTQQAEQPARLKACTVPCFYRGPFKKNKKRTAMQPQPKEIELIDYTGAIWGSHFLYVLPGDDWKLGQQYKVLLYKAPMGLARIAAITTIPLAKMSETVARAFMGKSAIEVKARYAQAYKMQDDTPISIMTWEWLQFDSESLKVLMTDRFNQMKGLRKHERDLQLNLF
jgi:hypothetical protein